MTFIKVLCLVFIVAQAADVWLAQTDSVDLVQIGPNSDPPVADAARFMVNISSCQCDFRELECLPSAACMTEWHASQKDTIALGVGVRSLLKKRSRFTDTLPLFIPIGKSFQAGAMRSWKRWVEAGTLPLKFAPGSLGTTDKLDWKKYPYCAERGLKGSACFFGDFAMDEELEGSSPDAPYPNLMEHQSTEASEQALKAFQELEDFRKVAMKDVGTLSGDSYLRSFAYLLHTSFNLMPSMTQVYKENAGEINPGVGDMKVSLHIRRADSCSSSNYQKAASTIDSHPQMTNVRMCYDNTVYIDALRRIKALYQRPLTVYLSSDDNKDILESIRKEHPDIYMGSTWRFLDYKRELFKYDGVIEGQADQNKAFMSETAVQDLWHMSHGEVFVGHLGSRFGKVGYLLAVSRQNSALPYVSVDGHNICCEIDEQCSRATKWMDNMVDCLTFSHELAGGPANADYWTVGSTVRERVKKIDRRQGY